MVGKLDKEQIKRFLVSHDNKKKQMGMDEKTTMVYINGKATYLDTESVKDTLKDMSISFLNNDIVENTIYNSIDDFKHTNISVKSAKDYFIINGSIQSRNDIINNGILLYGKYYKLIELESLTINKKYMVTDELIRYFCHSEKIILNKTYTKLEKALMGAVSNDSQYNRKYVDRKIKPLPSNIYLYTLSLGIEDILGIIDTLMENYITVDYSKISFIRNSRYPVDNHSLDNDTAVLNKIKFPFLCVEWVCTNLKKNFISNGGYERLYKSNDLINNGIDLTINTYNGLTLEESLVHYIFNFEDMLVKENGYSYIDIPTLYFDGEKNVSDTCRFIYLHGLMQVETIDNRRKIINVGKGNVYDRALKNTTMYSIVTSELELYSNITRLMSNDIIFNSIIEFYFKALDIFNDKIESFKDHVIEFDIDNPDLKVNIKDHIFKYRYNEARKYLITDDSDLDETEADSDYINNYILNEENVNKETTLGVSKLIKKDKDEIKLKEELMRGRNVRRRN